MKKGYIYKITAPGDRVYIGQTTNIKGRFTYHKNASKISDSKLYTAIRECGWESCTKEILFEGEYNKQKFDELERYYINLHNSFNSTNGLNSVSGGSKGYQSSDSLKHKLSVTPRPPQSRESIEKGAKKRRGVPRPDDVRMKISKASIGKKMSKEACEKMSKAQMGNTLRKGCKLTEEQKLGMRGINAKPIGSKVLNKEWASTREAAREIGCGPCGLNHMLAGRVKNRLELYYVNV